MNPPLGIGIIYNYTLDNYFKLHPDSVDYLSLVPDTAFMDKGPGQPNRFDYPATEFEKLIGYSQRWPMVAHHVGFSLGSAAYFDYEYLENVQRLQEIFNFRWHSDHLSYSKLEDEQDGAEYNTCIALPVSFDEEVLNMVAEKTRIIRKKTGLDFLVENNVYFVDIPDQEYEEGPFLNKLCDRGDCGLLLDIHNVHTNATNFGFDPEAYIDSLDLSKVGEIHIAGGNMVRDIYLDSHSGPCPDEVWELLDYALPKCTNIGGVTYEFDESYIQVLGYHGVYDQLSKARAIWNKHKL